MLAKTLVWERRWLRSSILCQTEKVQAPTHWGKIRETDSTKDSRVTGGGESDRTIRRLALSMADPRGPQGSI